MDVTLTRARMTAAAAVAFKLPSSIGYLLSIRRTVRRSTLALWLVVIGMFAAAWPFVGSADHQTPEHWRAGEFPIALTVVARVGPRWEDVVDRKVRDWDNLTNPDRFQFTVAHRAAQNGCKFETGRIVICENYDPDFFGTTVTVTVLQDLPEHRRHITKAKIILSNRLHDEEPERQRRVTMCHEFGHALGLLPHGKRPNASCVSLEDRLDRPGRHDRRALESNQMYGHDH